jgi:hypothetical protein
MLTFLAHLPSNLLIQLFTALAALGAAWLSYAAKKDVKEIHLQVNSRMDKLLAVTEEAAHAKGADLVRAEGLARVLLADAEQKALLLVQIAKDNRTVNLAIAADKAVELLKTAKGANTPQ